MVLGLQGMLCVKVWEAVEDRVEAAVQKVKVVPSPNLEELELRAEMGVIHHQNLIVFHLEVVVVDFQLKEPLVQVVKLEMGAMAIRCRSRRTWLFGSQVAPQVV